MSQWDAEKARQYYSVSHWGDGYFDIDTTGHLVVYPKGPANSEAIPLAEIVKQASDSGLSLPLLLHFTDILHHRVAILSDAFHQAMQQVRYQGEYTVVYPIKVNQQRSVVEAIAAAGHRVGLEAGSKPELLAVMATANPDKGMIVCNGYKDMEFIRLAMTGRRMGFRIFLVVEKLSELQKIIDVSRSMAVQPLIGVRIRLASSGAGKWQNTGGTKAKFGLSTAQLLQLVQQLESEGLLGSLAMLHFHMGSQIANIDDIEHGVEECGRYYASLCQMGASIKYVNIGGGLGVDYDGTRSKNFFSMNYSIEQYARTIVNTLSDICSQNHLPYPDIISESGRALTAHHAVLVTNVTDIEKTAKENQVPEQQENDPEFIQGLFQLLDALSTENASSIYTDAGAHLNRMYQRFNRGRIDLSLRARAEAIFVIICLRVQRLLRVSNNDNHKLLNELDTKLADKFFCNYSIFQSIPDVWALEQIFPILPLNRLNEEPVRRVIIEDITCDSDGRIDSYVDNGDVAPALLLHELNDGEPYLLGIFLVGAYQEILGDMHNLFGDENSVDVKVGEDGYTLIEKRPGNTVASVLSYVHFDPEDIRKNYQEKIAHMDHLDAQQKQDSLAILEQGLQAYTYLQSH
ncbi:MAG: arginine decarboxylase [Gammaproteobacteria bacterium]|nr:MAG: arginine decarboxylase [Gammaproteobacteria bacterium]